MVTASHPEPGQPPRFIEAYIDGGQFGRNPTPFGIFWSVVIEGMPDSITIYSEDRSGKYKTNNEAEWMALREVLLWAIEHVPNAAVVVHSDSKHVVNCFTGRTNARTERILRLILECRRLAAQLPMVETQWVPRDVSVDILGH